MGYRSEVRICLLKKNFEELKKKCENLKYNLMQDFDYIDDSECGPTVVFGWNWVKWYEEFDEVAAIENYLFHLDDDIPYSFVRIGEDRDDIEEYRHYCSGECDRIRPVSYIEVD